MRTDFALFLVESAIKLKRVVDGNFRDPQSPYEFGILNPYRQWPKVPKRLPFMDRPFAPGYSTLPEMSRSGFGPAIGVLTRPFVVPAGVALTYVITADIEKELIDEIVETESVSSVDKIRFLQGVSGY